MDSEGRRVVVCDNGTGVSFASKNNFYNENVYLNFFIYFDYLFILEMLKIIWFQFVVFGNVYNFLFSY